MKMKMTNAEMDEAIAVLESLEETGKVGYAIARNLRKLRDSATEYLDIKMSALEKYGDRYDLEDGRSRYIVPMSKPDKVEAYLDEIGEISKIEHEVEIFTIPEEDFYSCSLKSNQMEKILWMVE